MISVHPIYKYSQLHNHDNAKTIYLINVKKNLSNSIDWSTRAKALIYTEIGKS